MYRTLFATVIASLVLLPTSALAGHTGTNDTSGAHFLCQARFDLCRASHPDKLAMCDKRMADAQASGDERIGYWTNGKGTKRCEK
jgi:hypothetical protein